MMSLLGKWFTFFVTAFNLIQTWIWLYLLQSVSLYVPYAALNLKESHHLDILFGLDFE